MSCLFHVLDWNQTVISSFTLPMGIPAKAVEVGILLRMGGLLATGQYRGNVHVFTENVFKPEGCVPLDSSQIAAQLNQSTIHQRCTLYCTWIPGTSQAVMPEFHLYRLIRMGAEDLWARLRRVSEETRFYSQNAVYFPVWKVGFLDLALSDHNIDIDMEDIKNHVEIVNWLLSSSQTSPLIVERLEFIREIIFFIREVLTASGSSQDSCCTNMAIEANLRRYRLPPRGERIDRTLGSTLVSRFMTVI